MAYTYITQYSSPNYTPAEKTPQVYGGPRQITGITIHHWGVTGQSFQGVVNYLCRRGGNTSAHYVVEAGRVACIVAPADTAWHAGNATGNRTTIGIECRPEATDGDYETVAELVRDLRATYGPIRLYRHSDWKNTACPGRWDLARIDRLAAGQPASPTPVPSPDQEEDIMIHYVFDAKTSDGSTAVYWWNPRDNTHRWLAPSDVDLAHSLIGPVKTLVEASGDSLRLWGHRPGAKNGAGNTLGATHLLGTYYGPASMRPEGTPEAQSVTI